MLFRFAILLLAGLSMWGCRKQPSPTVFVDPALATLVPSDTVFIAGVRVEQLHATSFWKKYIAERKLPVVEEFAHQTGIDPRKDLWEVVIPYDGKTSWVMLRGKFTEMGMEPRVNREDAKRMGYKGYTMLGDETMAVMFLNPTTAVASSFESLKSIVDNRDKGTGIPQWLQDKIKTIPSTNQAWFAGNLAGRIPQLPGRDLGRFAAIAPLIQSIGILTGAVDLKSGVDARVTAETPSEQDARRLRDAVKGLVGMGRLNTPENKRHLLRLYDGIHAEDAGSAVNVQAEIPEDLLNELIGLLPTASGQGSHPQD